MIKIIIFINYGGYIYIERERDRERKREVIKIMTMK
jgi:hypothetical protein